MRYDQVVNDIRNDGGGVYYVSDVLFYLLAHPFNLYTLTCCAPILQTFVNVPTVTVDYTGSKPVVSVTYLIDGVWQAAGVFTPITITDTQVIVDNGGNATGVVKLTQ